MITKDTLPAVPGSPLNHKYLYLSDEEKERQVASEFSLLQILLISDGKKYPHENHKIPPIKRAYTIFENQFFI